MTFSARLLSSTFAILLAGSMSSPAVPAEAKITLESVTVTPSDSIAPDKLCKLKVEIQNTGDKTAYSFGFTVKINGKEVPIYKNLLYLVAVDPGSKKELDLYNFWSTEKGREAPTNGKVEVEVTLKEAKWVEIKMEDDVQVWTPIGDVEGLPSAKSVSIPFKAKKG